MELRHLYRAMAWLGEVLEPDEQVDPALFGPRPQKDRIEEELFGKSKDHRPDRHPMIVGALLGHEGRPICSELWPDNTTDVKTLLPVVERLRSRFALDDLQQGLP